MSGLKKNGRSLLLEEGMFVKMGVLVLGERMRLV